jgi:hypothetical protein
MIASFVSSPRLLAAFLGTYLLAFLKMTQEGLVGYVTGAMVWENQGIPRLNGSTPMYAHPNTLAGTQLGTVPFLAGLLPFAPSWLRLIMIGQTVGVLVVIVVCGSRTAYVALVGWVLFRLARTTHKLRALIVTAAIIAAALPLVPSSYQERFISIFTGQEKEGASSQARLEILADAWQVFLSHPFGVGVGAFPIIREQMFGRSQDTHNLYLEIATNLGVPGLLVFGGFLIAVFRALRRIDTRAKALLGQLKQDSESNHLDQGATSAAKLCTGLQLVRVSCEALLGFLVIRLYLGLFGMDLYEVYWWFSAGLTVALARIVTAIDTELAAATREGGTPAVIKGARSAVFSPKSHGHSMRENAAERRKPVLAYVPDEKLQR